MSTINQIHIKYKRIVKEKCKRTVRLLNNPFLKGIVTKVTIMNPKKPNSAMRHVGKINLYKGAKLTARVVGIGYMILKFNRVLIRGGRANDLPGVNYTIVRGVYDCSPLFNKLRKRSKYGVKKKKKTK